MINQTEWLFNWSTCLLDVFVPEKTENQLKKKTVQPDDYGHLKKIQ